MAPPLYFLPGVTHQQLRPRSVLEKSILAERRLDKVLADVSPMRVSMSNLHHVGPGGEHGLLLRAESQVAGAGMASVSYTPESQTWERVHDGERTLYWLGIDKASPPRPADLQRATTIPGELVKLADGQHWQAPLIRRPPDHEGRPAAGMHATSLPCRVEFGWNGANWQTIKPEYLDIWARSARVFDLLWADVELVDGEEVAYRQFALDCLALNYRIGPAEASIFGLFDSTALAAVAEAACGIMFFARLAESKKNSPLASQSTGPGP